MARDRAGRVGLDRGAAHLSEDEPVFPDLDRAAIAAGVAALQSTMGAHPSVQVVSVVLAVLNQSPDVRAFFSAIRDARSALGDLADRAEGLEGGRTIRSRAWPGSTCCNRHGPALKIRRIESREPLAVLVGLATEGRGAASAVAAPVGIPLPA
jgi:hypothetical protein